MIQKAISKLQEQQSKVKERSPQWMVARQLMDLVRAEPQCAEILAQDLEVEAMSITEAEKKIKAFADAHKTAFCGNSTACLRVPAGRGTA